jgi:hypothetical protein
MTNLLKLASIGTPSPSQENCRRSKSAVAFSIPFPSNDILQYHIISTIVTIHIGSTEIVQAFHFQTELQQRNPRRMASVDTNASSLKTLSKRLGAQRDQRKLPATNRNSGFNIYEGFLKWGIPQTLVFNTKMF